MFHRVVTSSLVQSVVCQPTTSLRYFSAVSDRLSDAMTRVRQRNDLSNDDLLKLYGLFKQASHGVNNTDKPGMMDFVGKAKWSAWSDLGDMSKADAEEAYVAFVDELTAKSDSDSNSDASSSSPDQPVLLQDLNDGVLTLTFNRPDRFNAFNFDLYDAVTKAMEESADNDDARVVLFTGKGQFYSSGNDLSNFSSIPPEGPAKMAADACAVLQRFVESFINFPKPMMAAVNGPAIGIPCTLLGLFDAVYATHSAYFKTPFTALGQSPEACSSYTFPNIMGPTQAAEMLLFGRVLTAVEARDRRLVTDVFEASELMDQVQARAKHAASLPPNAMKLGRALIRSQHKQTLLDTNIAECKLLEERWVSEECFQALAKFAARKN